MLNIGIDHNILENDIDGFVKTNWQLPIENVKEMFTNFDLTHPDYIHKVPSHLRNWFQKHNVEFHFNIIGQNFKTNDTSTFLQIVDTVFDINEEDIICISGDIALNYRADKSCYDFNFLPDRRPVSTTLSLHESDIKSLLRVPNSNLKPKIFRKLFNANFSNFQMPLDNNDLPLIFQNVLDSPEYADMLQLIEFNRIQGYHTVSHLYRRNKFEEPWFKAPLSQAMMHTDKIDEALEMKDLTKLGQSVEELKQKYGGGSYRLEISFTFKRETHVQHVSTEDLKENLGKVNSLCRDIAVKFIEKCIAVPCRYFTDAIYLFSRMICNAIKPILHQFKNLRIVPIETKNMVAVWESVLQASLNGDLWRYFNSDVERCFVLKNNWIWLNRSLLENTGPTYYFNLVNENFCSRKVGLHFFLSRCRSTTFSITIS